MNTPTPRNNAFTAAMNGKDDTEHLIELDKFSRQLEIELAAAREELTQAYAKLDRILKLTIHDDTFWAIEEIARISGGESDCSVCGGCFMIPGSEENDDVMNTPCPKCNAPESISNQ